MGGGGGGIVVMKTPVGTCYSTDQNGTTKSRFVTEKVDRKSRNLSCRVVNSVDFQKESQRLNPKIRSFQEMDLKMYVFLKNDRRKLGQSKAY